MRIAFKKEPIRCLQSPFSPLEIQHLEGFRHGFSYHESWYIVLRADDRGFVRTISKLQRSSAEITFLRFWRNPIPHIFPRKTMVRNRGSHRPNHGDPLPVSFLGFTSSRTRRFRQHVTSGSPPDSFETSFPFGTCRRQRFEHPFLPMIETSCPKTHGFLLVKYGGNIWKYGFYFTSFSALIFFGWRNRWPFRRFFRRFTRLALKVAPPGRFPTQLGPSRQPPIPVGSRADGPMPSQPAASWEKLDDGWPESEKDVFQAALRMVVVKDSRWIVGEFYMSYGKIWCEKVSLIKKRIFGKGHQMTCVLQPQRERGGER